LIVPLTTDAWERQILHIRRQGSSFAARFVRPCGFIPCMGARDSRSEALLAEALGSGGMETVRSLRRDSHGPDASCWLHGEKYCLSRNSP
jgi:protein-L-isoaspartate(D-aspartate) O-methyltransferase